MNPRLRDVLSENRYYSYVLSIYDVYLHGPKPWSIKQQVPGEFVIRVPYNGPWQKALGRRRKNMDFRFKSDADRLAAAEALDEYLGGALRMRVWDDRPIRRK